MTPSLAHSRRDFLRLSAAIGSFALARPLLARARLVPDPPTPLKILILGGTSFLGPHLVRLALAQGHTVTIFNRGRTERRIGGIPEGVERLVGDRDPKIDAGLAALQGDRAWDLCIDNSGYFPRHVAASAQLLARRVRLYTFISSISAYAEPLAPNADESAPLATLSDPATEDLGHAGENYGGLKALCERAAIDAFPTASLILRPGLIVGPGDPTDRFTYWPVRIAKGGEVLCPNSPDDPIQFIDVRDLAQFILLAAQHRLTGAFNAVGPIPPTTIGHLVQTSIAASHAEATPVWVSTDFLLESNVLPWSGMPAWVPPEGDTAGLARVRANRAIAAGLSFRPLDATVADTLAWWPMEVQRRTRVTKELRDEAQKLHRQPPPLGDPSTLRAGVSPDREKEVIAAWHALHPAPQSPDKPG